MVVGVCTPAKRTAPWRANRFGAAADANPGHGNGAQASDSSLHAEGRDRRPINVRVEGFGHRSGGLRLYFRNAGRVHDERASTDSVADVDS